MRAWRYTGSGKPLERADIGEPSPGPGEVLVRIRAAGLCHSDLHFLERPWPMPVPLTMGHEGAGEIAAVGAGVVGVAPGTRVVIHGANACGECVRCLEDRGNLCLRREQLGLTVDGCFADYVTCRASAVVEVPSDVADAAAAVTADAVLTPYHALCGVARIRPGERVAIFGLGGLGMNALQIALHAGANVTAIDTSAAAREAALALGAESTAADGRALKPSYDAAVDFVGAETTILSLQHCLRSGGRGVLAGLHAERADLVAWRYGAQEIALHGTYWGTASELRACVDLVARGAVVPRVETHPLDTINEQVQRLRAGRAAGRIVLEP